MVEYISGFQEQQREASSPDGERELCPTIIESLLKHRSFLLRGKAMIERVDWLAGLNLEYNPEAKGLFPSRALMWDDGDKQELMILPMLPIAKRSFQRGNCSSWA